jgi:hypothetical protein
MGEEQKGEKIIFIRKFSNEIRTNIDASFIEEIIGSQPYYIANESLIKNVGRNRNIFETDYHYGSLICVNVHASLPRLACVLFTDCGG